MIGRFRVAAVGALLLAACGDDPPPPPVSERDPVDECQQVLTEWYESVLDEPSGRLQEDFELFCIDRVSRPGP